MTRLSPARLAALALVLATGCASLLPQVGPAAGEALTGALDRLDDPAYQERVQRLAAQIAAASAQAAVEAWADPKVQAQLRGQVQAMAAGAAEATLATLQQRLAPVVADATAQALETALRRLAADPRNLRILTAAAGEGFATGFRDAGGLAMQLEPKLPDLDAGIASPQTTHALGALAREIARQAVFGSQDALAEIEHREKHHDGPESALTKVGDAMEALQASRIAAAVFAVLVVGMLLWMARAQIQAKRDREQARQRDAALLMLAERLQPGKPGEKQVLDLLRDVLGKPEREGWLRRWRREHPWFGGRGGSGAPPAPAGV